MDRSWKPNCNTVQISTSPELWYFLLFLLYVFFSFVELLQYISHNSPRIFKLVQLVSKCTGPPHMFKFVHYEAQTVDVCESLCKLKHHYCIELHEYSYNYIGR